MPLSRLREGSIHPLMGTTTLAILISPEDVWIAVALISIWMVMMSLKTIGHCYFTAVSWHNLKVEAHDMRTQHLRELKTLRQDNLSKKARRARGLEALPDRDQTNAPDAEATPESDLADAA